MFKNLLSSNEFMDVWSIITMIIFLVAFIFVVIYTIKTDKRHTDYMSTLPLQDNINENK
jgi:cbb3-type cytochrome oxidase subunit 3